MGDFYYIFNQLFIEKFILWIQLCDDLIFNEKIAEINFILSKIEKASLELDLDYIETQAQFHNSSLKKTNDELILDSDDDD